MPRGTSSPACRARSSPPLPTSQRRSPEATRQSAVPRALDVQPSPIPSVRWTSGSAATGTGMPWEGTRTENRGTCCRPRAQGVGFLPRLVGSLASDLAICAARPIPERFAAGMRRPSPTREAAASMSPPSVPKDRAEGEPIVVRRSTPCRSRSGRSRMSTSATCRGERGGSEARPGRAARRASLLRTWRRDRPSRHPPSRRQSWPSGRRCVTRSSLAADAEGATAEALRIGRAEVDNSL